MRKKLMLTYAILILIAIGTSLFAYGRASYSYLDTQNIEKNVQCARLLRELLEQGHSGDASKREVFVTKYSEEYGIRITLIGLDGEVYEDSLMEELENHATRKEVMRALEGEEVVIQRYSTTLQMDCMYVAVPVRTVEFTGVLRVCVTMENIQMLQEAIVGTVVMSMVIGVVLAFIGAIVFSRMISKPIEDVTLAAQRISKGMYDTKIYTRERTQIGELAGSFNVMSNNMKETIDKLTRKNSELEAIIGSMGAGVVAIDDSSNILFVNHDFLNIFQLTPKFTEHRALYNVLREQSVFQVIDEVRSKHDRVVLTAEIHRPNQKHIRITGSPLVMEGGDVFGILLIVNDITHINKLESMRRDFVSNVTHELKTPLTSIHGFVDTLRHGAIDDPNVAQHFLEIIDIETERLSNLINDILTLSEIESKRDYNCVPFPLQKGLDNVIELLECQAAEAVTLTFECEGEVAPLMCNPARMEQLFINLIENALKYTEEGYVRVTLQTENDEIVLRVQDTGFGIPDDQLERIFERFYRVDKGRSRSRGGTGLGLSIAKHIVELYHGSIRVCSQVDVGSTFEVRFPMVQEE